MSPLALLQSCITQLILSFQICDASLWAQSSSLAGWLAKLSNLCQAVTHKQFSATGTNLHMGHNPQVCVMLITGMDNKSRRGKLVLSEDDAKVDIILYFFLKAMSALVTYPLGKGDLRGQQVSHWPIAPTHWKAPLTNQHNIYWIQHIILMETVVWRSYLQLTCFPAATF